MDARRHRGTRDAGFRDLNRTPPCQGRGQGCTQSGTRYPAGHRGHPGSPGERKAVLARPLTPVHLCPLLPHPPPPVTDPSKATPAINSEPLLTGGPTWPSCPIAQMGPGRPSSAHAWASQCLIYTRTSPGPALLSGKDACGRPRWPYQTQGCGCRSSSGPSWVSPTASPHPVSLISFNLNPVSAFYFFFHDLTSLTHTSNTGQLFYGVSLSLGFSPVLS